MAIGARKKGRDIRMMLYDEGVPLDLRRHLLVQLCRDESEAGTEALKSLLSAAAAQSTEMIESRKTEELGELMKQMQEGPLRPAVFLAMAGNGDGPRRAHVVLDDGTGAYTAVPDPKLAELLRCGDGVLLEGQGHALLARCPKAPASGEEGRLETVIDPRRVEVTMHDQGRYVFHSSADLQEKIASGEAKPGAKLLVCPRRRIAFDTIPAADGFAHYRYLCREPVPDFVAERDMGSPPEFIEKVSTLVLQEMLHPDRRRRYRLRSVVTKLLAGVSGSGKTLSILVLWRRIYERMSEVTGVPIAELPPRVLRLRMATILSRWLGDSDRNLDRFFDEAEALAGEPFHAPDGRRWRLPVLAILEEVDGLARSRGEDAIYDRILTTALQRLDPTRPELADRLILFLATTNVPQQVDIAFLRRIGGTVETFSRLGRRSFAAVLYKHLHGVPLASPSDGDCTTHGLVREMADWLYSPNGSDPGQVEIHLVGSNDPLIKRRRDFLTGGVVDLAVREASEEAWLAETAGTSRPGLTRAMLQAAFDRQVRSLVDRLSPANAGHYVELPDGARVASVRRIDRPALPEYQLERID